MPSAGSTPPPVGGSSPVRAPSFDSTGVTAGNAPLSSSLSTTAPTNALSPEGFAQNFNNGAQAGGPVSSGAEGLSNTAAHAMQPQAPLHSESMAAPPMAPTAPSAGAPLFETGHAAPTYDTAQAPVAPPADTTQTYVAAPAAQAPVMPSTAAPAAPQGPLPAYGADLRPPRPPHPPLSRPCRPPPPPDPLRSTHPPAPNSINPPWSARLRQPHQRQAQHRLGSPKMPSPQPLPAPWRVPAPS
ncbi:hypothetical protein ACQ86B_24660 [Mycolicibacterium aichiense]|uniref:hypothetical protein n=1 Tax=Mycolicibacterium aichiense TaxID=1799 RepID=UPI003D67311F